MAIADAYADNDTYKAIIGSHIGEDDSQIDDQLVAVSRALEHKLGQFFNRDDAVVDRIFYPSGYALGDPDSENPWLGTRASRELDLRQAGCPGISTTTGLVIKIDTDRDGSFADESALPSTDYELRPLNADKGPEQRPWSCIYLPAWSTQFYWPSGSRVQVTARFGWPDVPMAIIQATCELTGLLRLESPRATSRLSEGIDMLIGTSRAAQDIVAALMAKYRVSGPGTSNWVLV